MRYLHTMLRVENLERSLLFYEKALGLKELRRLDYEKGRFTLVFLGFKDEGKETVLELTYNWDPRSYNHGDAYGHVAFEVEEIESAYQKALDAGAQPHVAPKEFMPGTMLAFVKDPDGYEIEFLEYAKGSKPWEQA